MLSPECQNSSVNAEGAVTMLKPIARLALVLTCFPLWLTLCRSQDEPWRIDAGHSTASLSLSSLSGADSLNVGIAKVSGTIRLDSEHATDNVFDLNIYPARRGRVFSTPTAASNLAVQPICRAAL
jgi:hypothetical protein